VGVGVGVGIEEESILILLLPYGDAAAPWYLLCLCGLCRRPSKGRLDFFSSESARNHHLFSFPFEDSGHLFDMIWSPRD